MRIWKLALGVFLANAVIVSTALAQQGLRQPVQKTAFEYDYYQAPPAPSKDIKSPSDKPAPMPSVVAPAAPPAPAPMPPAPTPMVISTVVEGGYSAYATDSAGPACGCESSCNSCGCGLNCPEGPPVCRLFDECCWLKCNGLTLTGYLNTGYSINNNADKFNGPIAFNDRSNEFELNQAYIALEKATKAGDCDWDLGGRIDVMYGTDARWVESSGLEKTSAGQEKWVTNQRFYHLALVQAYAEVAYDDVKIKAGKWITLMGAEVIDVTGNFFYSHSYTFSYGIAYTHTGLMATKTVDEQLSYSLGITTGWDNFFDNQNRVDFMGSVTLTSCDKSSNLVFTIMTGDERRTDPDADPAETNRTAYTIVYNKKLNDRLSWTIEHVLGVQQKGAFDPATETEATRAGRWYGITNYLTYQLNCDWWLGGRFEWFRDPDGTRVLPVGDSLTGGTANAATNVGYEGNFFEYTVGLNYKPVCNPNLVVRPEVRWDHFDGNTNNAPFSNGNKNDQFTFAIDATFKF